MSKQIFISHSHSDADVAKSICKIIEKQGISCWIAPRDVRPGKIWDDEIVNGIESCIAMIILVSDQSNNSLHVRKEIELAINQGNSIFPILIENVEPEKKLKFILTGIQWVNAWKPPIEEHLNKLIQALQELIDVKKDDVKVKTVNAEHKIKDTPKSEGVEIKSPSMNIAQPIEDVKIGNKSIPAITTTSEEKVPTKNDIFQNLFGIGLRISAYIFGVILLCFFLYSTFIKKDDIGAESIAVLPFISIDRTEEGEIFSDGIHDDILTHLSKINDLRVIARTSVMRYRNTEKSIKEIAEELGVSSILEGSVRRSGDRIRIVAQLIDPETEDHIWAETYDRNYTDIFSIQSDVSQKIASALSAKLTTEEIQSINKIPTENLEAYEYYLQGKINISRGFEINNLETAKSQFEKAIELDPNFASAYAKLSYTYLSLGWRSLSISDDLLKKVKNILNKGIALDQEDPEVLIAEGYYYYWGLRDYELALEKLSAALQKNPNNSELLYTIGIVKRRRGQWDEALDLLIKASNLDPHSYAITMAAGLTASYVRKWKKAEQFYNLASQIDPTNKKAYIEKFNLAISNDGDLIKAESVLKEALQYIHPNELKSQRAEIEYLKRNYDNALEVCKEYQETGEGTDIRYLWDKGKFYTLKKNNELAAFYFDSIIILCERILRSNPDNLIVQKYLAMAYGRLDMKDQAILHINNCFEIAKNNKDAIQEIDTRFGLVDIYLSSGEYQKAINEINLLLSIPSGFTINRLKIDPIFDTIHDMPDYKKLIAKYD